MKNLRRLGVVWFVVANLIISFCGSPLYAEAKGDEVTRLIKGLQLGRPFSYRNLTLVPIYSTNIPERMDYVTLDEAVKNGYILITEIEGGRVPQVKVTNKSDQYIFLLSGEILSGARQNRLVGKDVLLGPQDKEVIVPVYCVEQGRWDTKTYSFHSEGLAAAPMMRNYAAKSASQSEIWNGVSNMSKSLGVHSVTGDLGETYRDRKIKEKTDKYVEALKDIPRLDEDAVGVAVAIGKKIVAIDIFGNPQLFSQLWSKLLRSYAMGAIAVVFDEEEAQITQDEVKRILSQLYERRYERKEGIALGEELTTTTAEITATALVYRGKVVHFSAFPNENGREPVINRDRIPVIVD